MGRIVRKKVLEYDIRKCGMSILLNKEFITEEIHKNLLTMDKKKSSMFITTTLRNKIKKEKGIDILEVIKRVRDETVKTFIWSNNLNKDDIIEVAFDAIWTTKYCRKLSINDLQFVSKRSADLVLELDKYIIYFSLEDGVYFRNIKEENISDKVKSLVKMLCVSLYHKYTDKIFKYTHDLYIEKFITRNERDTILLTIL